MNISLVLNIVRFLLGFILGLTLVAGTTGGAAYYYFTKMSAAPPKPVFAEEETLEPPPVAEDEIELLEPTSSPLKSQPAPKAESQPAPKVLPPGAYKARVTWSEGLSLRSQPNVDSEKIGGIPHRGEMIVLEDSQDKQWQKVRYGDRQGWVKAGNASKIE